VKTLSILNKAAIAIGTTLGSGFFPIAPGTVGSAIAITVLVLLPTPSVSMLIGVIVIMFLVGIWAAGRCEKIWGKDPGRVNWDEVVGQCIALLWIPKTGLFYLLGFLLFRFFDILKPSPVRDAEKLPAGLGIMADDVAAGIYANLVLQVGRYACEKLL
jgi:phosphatidylglycerophosphatase A